MTECPYWRVRIWLGEHIIEERVAPGPLAERYADILRLRFPDRRLTCEPISEHEGAYPSDRPHDPRD